MNRTAQPSRLRRGAAFMGLAATLGLVAVGLTQCRLAEESVTGLDLKAGSSAGSRADCVHACNDAYRDGREAEDARWKAAVRACGTDLECQRAANRAHNEILQGLVDAMQACKNNCYNEGGGSGGR